MKMNEEQVASIVGSAQEEVGAVLCDFLSTSLKEGMSLGDALQAFENDLVSTMADLGEAVASRAAPVFEERRRMLSRVIAQATLVLVIDETAEADRKARASK